MASYLWPFGSITHFLLFFHRVSLRLLVRVITGHCMIGQICFPEINYIGAVWRGTSKEIFLISVKLLNFISYWKEVQINHNIWWKKWIWSVIWYTLLGTRSIESSGVICLGIIENMFIHILIIKLESFVIELF